MDPVFSQFYAAPIYLNPAFAGSTLCSRIALSQRLISGPENFYTANFSYDRYIEALNGGIGIMVTSDQTNMYMMRNSISAMYAYHLEVSHDLSINFGMQAGYIGNYSRWGRFVFPVEEPEPDHRWRNNIDFAAGILLFSPKVYGGVAVHHLHEPNMSLYNDASSPLQRKLTAHLGLYFEPSGRQMMPRDEPGFFVSPNMILQMQGDFRDKNHSHAGMGVYFGKKPIMVGVWGRVHWYDSFMSFDDSNNHFTFVALLGVDFDDYRIGLSYDVVFGASEMNYSEITNVFEVTFAMRFNCLRRNIGSRIINHP